MNELDQKRNSGGAREFGWEREPEWRTKVRDILGEYRLHLVSQEKSGNTIEKYIRDVKRFLLYAGSERPEREMVAGLQEQLKGTVPAEQRQFHADGGQPLSEI